APIHVFGYSLASGRNIYYLIWLLVLLAVWGTSNLLSSRPGRAIRALKDGAAMAESFGVNTAAYKIIIFMYAALLASVSGWLYAHMQRAVSPSPFGLNYGIEYLFMAVVGGAASVWGALVGSAAVLVVKDQLQNWLPRLLDTNANFEMIVFGVLLVIVLQYARDGLWSYIAAPFQQRRGKGEQKLPPPPEAPLLPQRPRPETGQLVLQVDAIRKE